MNERESSCSEGKHVKRYYKNNYYQKKRAFRGSDDDSPVRKRIHHLEINRQSERNENESSKSKHKRVKMSRYNSDDQRMETTDGKDNSGQNSRTFSQPEDTRIKFTSRSQRLHRDSFSDNSDN